MPWFKVDDQLYSHPKWLALSKGAKALWTTAGSWCASQPDNGHVPRNALKILDGRPAEARELVDAGMWEDNGNGWVFHDWLDFQPSAEQVKAERAAARERMRKAREAKKKRNGGTAA